MSFPESFIKLVTSKKVTSSSFRNYYEQLSKAVTDRSTIYGF